MADGHRCEDRTHPAGGVEPTRSGRDLPPAQRVSRHDPLVQAEWGRPVGKVVRAMTWTEARRCWRQRARREVRQPNPVLEVPHRVLDLGMAAMVGPEFERPSDPVGD